MFKILILVFAFSFYVGSVSAQRVLAGTCPTLSKNETYFDTRQFNGRWILTEATPSIFDFFLRCIEVEYGDPKDTSLSINIKGLSIGGLPTNLRGDGLIHDTNKTGVFNVRYVFGVPFQGSLLSVIDTDYKEYAVLHTCTNSFVPNLLHSEHIWVLTREGNLSNPTKQNILTMLDNLKINRNGLSRVDRKGCPTITSTQRKGAFDDLPGDIPYLKDISSLASPETGSENKFNLLNSIAGTIKDEATITSTQRKGPFDDLPGDIPYRKDISSLASPETGSKNKFNLLNSIAGTIKDEANTENPAAMENTHSAS